MPPDTFPESLHTYVASSSSCGEDRIVCVVIWVEVATLGHSGGEAAQRFTKLLDLARCEE